jgi:hypothetical protein
MREYTIPYQAGDPAEEDAGSHRESRKVVRNAVFSGRVGQIGIIGASVIRHR